MSQPLISLSKINKAFAGVRALQDVSLEIYPKEVRCLAGENGSGKSTLIKIIAGVYARDSGSIVINGKTYERLTPMDSIREGIQIIYQDFSLFPNLTVAENIAMNYQLAKEGPLVNWREIRELAQRAVKLIDLDIDIYEKVGNLSVAEKQLVAIARALLYDAKLIIMDEPTTSLTNREVQTLFGIINDLRAKGISILFVSHKLNEVFQISDTITILRNGRKVFDGAVAELDRESLEYYMTGRHIDKSDIYVKKIEGEKPLLTVENLSAEGRFKNISFSLYPGEILGIAGLLGSGRNELAHALFGLRPADSGTIRIGEEQVVMDSVQTAMRHGIAFVPEDRLTQGLLLEQTIANNINICTIDQLTDSRGWIDEERAAEQVEQWIGQLKIQVASPENPAKSLSGGNQQRIVIAKWLATKPKVLILSGPTVGVDVGSKEAIHKILRDLARSGMGIILISDDIPEITANCSRILLMRSGEIVAEYQAGQLSEDELSDILLAS